ncbi:hypothetical protein SAMN05444274_1138 [Mariniphaga anaerophila]|uniref:Two-component response regulator, SAPR family, consists of REC, wHTH and BTAD domains n=1 Tax=Mariniphaga anaerophila TaxID=1484053 RepID=A0A1M5FJN2_9BACT|nr:hypothetical protein [Mariniphaga anaerophila]SHF91695.1 hypothetical protein SAMN05444274_1138 [Mariniphaga anaerophila]
MSAHKVLLSVFLLAIILVYTNEVYSNDEKVRGLRFYSQEKPVEERTSLVLFPEPINIKQKLELEFEFKIYNKNKFGYIFSIQGGHSKKRMEPLAQFVFHPESSSGEGGYIFNFNGKTQPIIFSMEKENKNWIKCNLKINQDTGLGQISVSGQNYQFQYNNQNIKFLSIKFGQLDFLNGDVAAFDIRDIKCSIGNRKRYYWLLEQDSGTEAIDSINGKKAFVNNPFWLIHKHFLWEEVHSGCYDKMNGVSFDSLNQDILLVNKDSLSRFNTNKNHLKIEHYTHSRPFYTDQNFSLYNQKIEELISFDFHFFKSNGQKAFSSYIPDDKKWTAIEKVSEVEENYNALLLWNRDATRLIKFGGYAHYKYFNKLQLFNFDSLKWEDLSLKGDFVSPRTYASGGLFPKTNKLFIYGGMGNESGLQALGIRKFYDLYEINLDTKTVVKKWEITDDEFDFLPGSEMIINPDDSCAYILGVDSKSDLILYRFSLVDGRYDVVSNALPVKAEGLEGDSYLFYDSKEQALFAVVRESFEKETYSKISIFRLNYPPIGVLTKCKQDKKLSLFQEIIWLALCAGAVLIVFFIVIRRQRAKNIQPDVKEPTRIRKQNSVLLIGGFHVFDKNGTEITYRFSNKLRQLFCTIYLHNFFDVDITNDKLASIFWQGMDKQKITNNRGVSFNHLRNIFKELDGLSLIRKGDQLIIDVGESLYIDMESLYSNLKNSHYNHPENILSFYQLGNLLANESFPGIDIFKENFESKAIETILQIGRNYYSQRKHLSVIETMDIILNQFDTINEKALKVKIKSLYKLKQYKKAKSEYVRFCNEYSEIMNSEYPKQFSELLK